MLHIIDENNRWHLGDGKEIIFFLVGWQRICGIGLSATLMVPRYVARVLLVVVVFLGTLAIILGCFAHNLGITNALHADLISVMFTIEIAHNKI
jgi:hypothetical protein